MATDTTPIDPAPPQNPDPYVIYQLRKPSQRGTAVIPRFIPNTHAPPYSATNYRFARVWHTPDTSALLHAPRSFEYAGSLGSESSFWSETSSWVSVSSLRTAQSDRQPLLHSTPAPVSAASFFNSELETPHLRTPSTKPTSQLSSPLRDEYRFPPALSESISEDAVIDDLLHRRPDPPPPPPPPQRRRPSRDHTTPIHNNSTIHQAPRAAPYTSSRMPTKNAWPSLLPSLTRKRRNLWQWLFCSEPAAASTTVPSVSNTPHPYHPSVPSRVKASQTPRDRVPGGDKDFLRRANAAPDAKRGRRAPSFEIRRGRPEGSARRSISWSLMQPFLNREAKKSPAKDNRKSKTKSRAVPAEEDNRASRSIFHNAALKMGLLPRNSSDMTTNKPEPRRTQEKSRERSREDRHHEQNQHGRGDRPRHDRPRSTQSPMREGTVPNFRKETRVRSAESAEQITSRITSDLTNTTGERTRSGRSTPRVRINEGTDFSANPALSDVSSHASGPRASPLKSEEGAISPRLQGSAEALPMRVDVLGYTSSSDSGGLMETEQKREAPKGYPRRKGPREQESVSNMRDPVARAKEKNRLASAGGPLSYLNKQYEVEHDVDTQSTGLTSLADESVSTHKTLSGTGEELRGHRFPLKGSEEEGRRPIFKDAAIFAQMGRSSPSRTSSGSPGRLHSDWSDPHATDIDVYCQCNCSCVYEEECRRTCEAVYGRSTSVSSTTSGKREFHVLPPAIGPVGKNKVTSPPRPVAGEGFAGMSPLAKAPLEISVEKRFIRASAVDELPDIRRTEGDPGAGSTITEPTAVMSIEGASREAKRSEGHPRDSRRRAAPDGSNRKNVSSPTENVVRAGRNMANGREFRTSGGYPGKTRREEGKPSPRRRSAYDPHRDSSRRQTQDRTRELERRSREENYKKSADGSQQMGNSYVVKRSGAPPLNKASMPPPYRASGYGREVSYEYAEDGQDALLYQEGEIGFGAPPVVELEFETRATNKYDGQKRTRPESAGRNGTREVPKKVEGSPPERNREFGQQPERRREVGGQKSNSTPRGPTKQTRPTQRQTSKSSSRSRTPIFGIF